MPNCRNDPSRRYSGVEPSPKGLGWCAHAEKVHKKRMGRNGKPWVVKKFGKSKRWVPDPSKRVHKKQKQFTKSPKVLDLRMIIGYYNSEESQDMTKSKLKELVQTKYFWDLFNIRFDAVGVNTLNGWYDVVPVIRSQNIKSVKVLNPPIHNPTFWEKLIKKHQGYIYHPTFVVILDFKNVKLQPTTTLWKHQKQLEYDSDAKFLEYCMYNANYAFQASDGWIHGMKKGLGGSMKILQIGPLTDNIQVDYRQFGGTTPF
jgi:hypothetical protein